MAPSPVPPNPSGIMEVTQAGLTDTLQFLIMTAQAPFKTIS